MNQRLPRCLWAGAQGLPGVHGFYGEDSTRRPEPDPGWRAFVGGHDSSAGAWDRHR